MTHNLSNNIFVNGATLQSQATVYNLTFRDIPNDRLPDLEMFVRTKYETWKLNKELVNDAWFMWVIVNYYQKTAKVRERQFK
jgi:hypothetical protein